MKRPFGLADRDIRTLALGALAILAIVGFGRVGPRARGWASYQIAAADAATRRLVSVERLLASQSSLREDALATKAQLDTLGARLIAAPSPEEGGAHLLAAVERYAAASSMRLNSTAVQADTAFLGEFARVAVRAYGTADIQGLAEWLARVEQGGPLIRVSQLTVTQSEPAADDRAQESLRIEVLVQALIRRIPPDSPAAFAERAP